MSVIDIPRLEGGDKTPGAPGWLSCQDTDGNQLKPLIRCNCGEIMGIDAHHVHADGTVTASFHDRDGCGWHVWLKLASYDQGDMPPWHNKRVREKPRASREDKSDA